MENNEDILTQVEKAVLPILKVHGVEIVELKFHRQSREPLLRFLVDKPEGGITLGECAQLNQEIGNLLERMNLIEDHYVLEVASPGLDRQLKTEQDFKRVIGKQMQIVAKIPLEGAEGELIAVDLVGTLLEVSPLGIVLQEEEGDRRWEISLERIVKGTQKVQF